MLSPPYSVLRGAAAHADDLQQLLNLNGLSPMARRVLFAFTILANEDLRVEGLLTAQLALYIGVSKPSVVAGTRELLARGILGRTRPYGRPVTYTILTGNYAASTYAPVPRGYQVGDGKTRGPGGKRGNGSSTQDAAPRPDELASHVA